MIDPDPTKRPSAAQILSHTLFCKSEKKSNADLRRELEAAKLKLEITSKQLELITKEQEQTRRYVQCRTFSLCLVKDYVYSMCDCFIFTDL